MERPIGTGGRYSERLGIVVGSLLGIRDGIDDDGVKLLGAKLRGGACGIRWWVFCFLTF